MKNSDCSAFEKTFLWPVQRSLIFYLNRLLSSYLIPLLGTAFLISFSQKLAAQPSTVSQTTTTVEFTAPGTGTWTVPAGVKSITVEVWGAGGGGAVSNTAAGGGGGGYARSILLVTPGDLINYEVGAGGGPGTAGGVSDWDNGIVAADGGDAGSGGTGGAGGSSNTGDVTFNGGNGGDGGISGRGGGGGGGSATSSANGGDGQNNSGNTGGDGGIGEGNGGDGADGNNNNGNDGLNPGGGGGGESGPGGGGTSGTGGDGQIIITYTTYSVDLTGGPCWRSLTSPVQGATYADILSGLWTQGVAGADFTGGDSNVLLWPDVTGVSDASWLAPSDLDNVVPEGTGFLVSVFADDDFDGSADPFPKTISVSGVPYEADVSPGMNSNSSGWTFVGNPFGSSIDFDNVTKADLTDVAYVYDRNTGGPTNGNNGSWISTDGTVGDLANGEIAPFQGFFVQNDGSNPDITFTESSKIPGDADFYGKKKEIYAIRFQLEGEGVSSSAWLRFSENGSEELVKGDALQLYPFGGEFAILSTRKGDQLLDIAQYTDSPGELPEIPVYVETTKSGEYQITVTEAMLPPEMTLELHDLETGQTLPITPDFHYSFEINQPAKTRPDLNLVCGVQQEDIAEQFKPKAAKASYSDRFIIRTSLVSGGDPGELPQALALNQNYPNPFNPTTQITYQLPREADVRLEVFDMAGRRVATLVNESISAGTHTVNFDATNLSSGVYIYRLLAGSAVITKKLTLVK
jgi:hypothetical protein